MVDIQTARTNVTQARQVLTSQQAQVSEAEKRLAEQQASIPESRSQIALRQTYTGLKGRETRRKIAQAERGLTLQEQEIAGYKGKLGAYEKEIATAESQIGAAEREETEWKKAQEIANLMDRGVPVPMWTLAGGVADKVRQIQEGQQAENRSIAMRETLGTLGGKTEAEIQAMFTPQQYQQLVSSGAISYSTVEVPEVPEVKVIEPSKFDLSAKEIYAKSINESVRGSGIWKAIGTIKGAIEGTGEVVEVKLTNLGGVFSREVKTGGERIMNYGTGIINIPNKITQPIYTPDSLFKYQAPPEIRTVTFQKNIMIEPVGVATLEYDPLANAIGSGVKIAPYFVPYVGEALLIAGGTESIVKGETTKEKVLGGLEVAGGLIGLRLRTMETALTPPKKMEVTSVITSGKKMTVKNIVRPKEFKIGKEFGDTGTIGIGSSRGGTQTIISPTNPKVETVIRGKDWIQVQTSVGGRTSGEIITSKRNFFGIKNKYYVKYNVVGGKTEYEVSQVIEPTLGVSGGRTIGGGLKKVEDIKVAEENIFGYGEPLKTSGTKIDKTITTPNKFKVRTREEEKILKQNLIKIKESPIEIKEDLGLKTLETKKRVTIVSPAEQNILLTKKAKDTIGLSIPQKRLKPKFAKTQPPDVVELKKVLIKPESRSSLSIEGLTPRYEDVVQIQRKSVGEFTLYQPSQLEKVGERIKQSGLLKSKKAQLGFTEELLQNQDLQVLKNIQNVQVRRVVSPKLEQEQFAFVVPTQINMPTSRLDMGVISILKLSQQKKIEQRMNLDQVQLMDVAVINKEKLKLNQKSLVETKTALDTLSKLKTETLTRNQIDTTKFERTTTPKEPKTTKKIKIPIINLPSGYESKGRVKELGGRIFEAIKVSKGKEVSLGTERTSYLAGQKLKKALKQSLSASGYIQTEGKRLKFSEVAPAFGGEFTQGKFDITRIVQKRGTRLGTSQETFKIQKAKKIKRGGWL